MTEITLHLDSKNRVTLTKLLKHKRVDSVRATVLPNGDMVLKPMVSVPADEAWVYENPEVLKSIKEGLSQEGSVDRGSFSRYVDDEQ